MHVHKNIRNYDTNNCISGRDTRSSCLLRVPRQRLEKSRNAFNFYGPKLYNLLPKSMTLMSSKELKKVLKTYLIKKAYYSINECFTSGYIEI